MFKIIAIQTLSVPGDKYKETEGMKEDEKLRLSIRKSRYNSVMKVLHADTFYWIVKGYAFKDSKILRLGDILPDNFYSEKGPCKYFCYCGREWNGKEFATRVVI